MERKTKHRILGILVVVGLVIILLPLFQSTSEAPSETNLIQAPPFPDQASQTPQPEQSQQPAPQEQDMAEPQPLPLQDPSQDSGINAQPDDTVNADSPAQGTMPTPSNPANATPTPITVPESKSEAPSALPDTSSNETNSSANQALSQNTATTSQAEDAANRGSEFIYKNDENTDSPQIGAATTDAAPTAVKPTAAKAVKGPKLAKKKSAHKLASATKKHLAPLKNADEDGLFKLKGSVWVIQMGSFNNKANAIRLVNKLRESGYAAFIQQMASSTRVFVGPEAKQTHARTLASKINSEMHMQGIVISYKPLSI